MAGPTALGFKEHQPRIHQMDFGKGGELTLTADEKIIGITEKNDVRGIILGLIENLGDAALVLDIKETANEQAVGTIEFTGGANPSDGETVTINDGDNTVVFEFDSNNSVTGANTRVLIGANAAATLANLRTEIGNSVLKVITAIVTVGDPTISITVIKPGTGGNNVIAETGVNIAATGLAGGLDPSAVTFRVKGAGVTTFTVRAGGKGEFQLEDVRAFKRFLHFGVDDTTRRCRVTLKYASGRLVRRERVGAP